VKIFLIGLMGSGKSYWAHKAGKALGIPAFDLDKEIEEAEDKTIAEIFAEKGESYFRLKENEMLKTFADKENFILATGGGAPCFHDNMEWMNANGITIWIDEPLAMIAARLQQGKAHRPLIANVADENLEDFFYQMREKRKPFYSKAKYHLNGGHLTEKHFIEILSLYE
jgi:shikimate kinase